MKKLILSIMLPFAIILTAGAQRFALIDTEYILGKIPAYKSANDQLDQASKKYQAEVEVIAKEAQKIFQDYQAQSASLSAAQKTKKEDDIVAKEKAAAELKRTYFGPDGELSKMQERLINPLQDKIYEVVKEVAQSNGYDVILDRASASGIIFANPRIDISDEILRLLGYSN